MISLTWYDHFQVVPLPPWWPKMELKNFLSLFEDRFWCSRCLNERIEVSIMIGSCGSGATASLVAKNETKKLYQLFEDRFWCSRCLNDHIEVPNMIGSFASGTYTSLVAKNRTKKLCQLFEDRFWCSRCLTLSKCPTW